MQLVTVKELSAIIRVKESTLYAWASRGSIPSHKLNGLLRFDLDEIKEWVKSSSLLAEPVGKPVSKDMSTKDIDMTIKKAIESVKGKSYNKVNRKPGQKQSLRKEV